MSYLPQRFRSAIAPLRISDMAAADLKIETLIVLVATHLPKIFLNAVANKVDLNYLTNVWDLLLVDAVIRLENSKGESIRVAVAVRSKENKAFSLYSLARKAILAKIRKQLGINQYWVFCVSDKCFPDRDKWIDILYSQIDSLEENNCRLVIL